MAPSRSECVHQFSVHWICATRLQGSLSTDGTDAAAGASLGASPWGTSYGASPGMGGVTGMSWVPAVSINGFMARSQSSPGGG